MRKKLKTIPNNKAFVWGVFIATCLVGLSPHECLAVSDATLKSKWEASGLQDLLVHDIRVIASIIAASVGGVMAIMPNGPKKDYIWGTGGGILGFGFLIDFLVGGQSILI